MKYIKSIHDLVDLLTKKGKTGYIPRVDIDTAVYTASKDLFNDEYKLYEQTQEISDSMTVFKSDPVALALDGAGKATKPVLYHHLTSIRSGTFNIDVIDEAFIGTKIWDNICMPTLDYPVCVFYKTYIQFYPITTPNVTITFLMAPIKPVYAYTIVNGREVYDDTNSVDVEWNVTDQAKVTMRSLQTLGIVLADTDIVQLASVKTKME